MTIRVDALQLKKLFEAEQSGDPFKSADPDDVRSRQEAARLKQEEEQRLKKEKRTAELAGAVAAAKAEGLQSVFFEISDQGDTSWDRYGSFYYDEDEDIFVREGTEEVLTREELEEEYQEEYGGFMPAGTRIIFLDELIHLRDDLDEIIQREQTMGREST